MNTQNTQPQSPRSNLPPPPPPPPMRIVREGYGEIKSAMPTAPAMRMVMDSASGR